MNSEFHQIFEQVQKGEAAVFRRTVGGILYQRRFVPKDRLILLGGGHISQALIRIAVMLDFSVTVVDDRYDYSNSVRFPEADCTICDSFESAIQRLSISEKDYVCVLTRGHSYDKECVAQILKGQMPFYLGMIGSKRKVAGVFQSLSDEGVPDERINSVHAPIGVSIGSVTVGEIAVSICAEMISCRRAVCASKDENCLTQTEANSELLRFLSVGDMPRALVMILSASGSTPARSGAVMAVDSVGRTVGTIGGGCAEAQAVRRAMKMIGSGKSAVMNIRMDNNAAAEDGLVCGGTIQILIEDITEVPYETDSNHP